MRYFSIVFFVSLILIISCKKVEDKTNDIPQVNDDITENNDSIINEPETINDLVFNSSLNYDSISDIEGNIYKTIQIGEQTWMAENLRTSTYNDSTKIPYVIDDMQWEELHSDGYCWYNNDSAKYSNIYGALYNWYVVEDDKICPEGWHIPNNDEWDVLSNLFGGNNNSGVKLKEVGLYHWDSPNSEVTNESGFTAIPGGVRDGSGSYTGLGHNGYWWNIDEFSLYFSNHKALYNNNAHFNTYSTHKQYGMSIRCIKD